MIALSYTDKLLQACDLMQAAIDEALKDDMNIQKFQCLIDGSRQLLDDGTETTLNVQLYTISPLETRAAAISEALNDPFIDRATACELIDELAEIEIKLEKE